MDAHGGTFVDGCINMRKVSETGRWSEACQRRGADM